MTSGDIRTVNESGRYYVSGTVSNLPSSVAHYVDVYVYSTVEGGYKHLVACNQSTGAIYTCKCTAGVWTDWQQLAYTSDLTNFQLTHLGLYTGDLNDITYSCACFAKNATNAPSGVNTMPHPVITLASKNGAIGWGNYPVIVQIYMVNDNGAYPYIRYCYAGTWYLWHLLS